MRFLTFGVVTRRSLNNWFVKPGGNGFKLDPRYQIYQGHTAKAVTRFFA